MSGRFRSKKQNAASRKIAQARADAAKKLADKKTAAAAAAAAEEDEKKRKETAEIERLAAEEADKIKKDSSKSSDKEEEEEEESTSGYKFVDQNINDLNNINRVNYILILPWINDQKSRITRVEALMTKHSADARTFFTLPANKLKKIQETKDARFAKKLSKKINKTNRKRKPVDRYSPKTDVYDDYSDEDYDPEDPSGEEADAEEESEPPSSTSSEESPSVEVEEIPFEYDPLNDKLTPPLHKYFYPKDVKNPFYYIYMDNTDDSYGCLRSPFSYYIIYLNQKYASMHNMTSGFWKHLNKTVYDKWMLFANKHSKDKPVLSTKDTTKQDVDIARECPNTILFFRYNESLEKVEEKHGVCSVCKKLKIAHRRGGPVCNLSSLQVISIDTGYCYVCHHKAEIHQRRETMVFSKWSQMQHDTLVRKNEINLARYHRLANDKRAIINPAETYYNDPPYIFEDKKKNKKQKN